MEWAEPLPKFCPPEDTINPSGELFYRIIESDEPTKIDFHSHRRRWPKRNFSTNECRTRSLSIYNALNECKKVRLLPLHRNKKIVEIFLSEESGVIKKTGKRKHHFSWWRYKSFNPLNHCKIILS